ncbi:hypothetical protein CU311_05960 [Prochlorococcus marinus str. MU1402]|nr:hypothetical protein [Prochlorococcus marinus str. MU1402]
MIMILLMIEIIILLLIKNLIKVLKITQKVNSFLIKKILISNLLCALKGFCPLFVRFFCGHNLANKKDRLGNLSITWILRVGATGFEPAT